MTSASQVQHAAWWQLVNHAALYLTAICVLAEQRELAQMFGLMALMSAAMFELHYGATGRSV